MFSKKANQDSYPFSLPALPYDVEKFGDTLSKESFEYHHGKHHRAYVTKLNDFASADQSLQNKSLEQIISSSSGAVFNNAAQVWNHSFFWHCISPDKQNLGEVTAKMIDESFGSFNGFKDEFKKTAMGQFGSGWVWLVVKSGKLELIKTTNAQTPITNNMRPVLCCDVWEHAYYIDYRNDRASWAEEFLARLINWDFVESNIKDSL